MSNIQSSPISNLHQYMRMGFHWCRLVQIGIIGLLVQISFSSPVSADVPLEEVKGLPQGYQGLGTVGAPSTLEQIISKSVGFLTLAAGLAFMIYVLLAGLTWITSREESERISRAKQMFTNALIGLAIVVVSWAFTGIMQTVFGFDILSPADLITNFLKP